MNHHFWFEFQGNLVVLECRSPWQNGFIINIYFIMYSIRIIMKITKANIRGNGTRPHPTPQSYSFGSCSRPLVIGEDLQSIFFAIGKVKKMVDMLYVYAVQYETAIEKGCYKQSNIQIFCRFETMSCLECTVKFFVVLFFIQVIQLWYFKPLLPEYQDPIKLVIEDLKAQNLPTNTAQSLLDKEDARLAEVEYG